MGVMEAWWRGNKASTRHPCTYEAFPCYMVFGLVWVAV